MFMTSSDWSFGFVIGEGGVRGEAMVDPVRRSGNEGWARLTVRPLLRRGRRSRARRRAGFRTLQSGSSVSPAPVGCRRPTTRCLSPIAPRLVGGIVDGGERDVGESAASIAAVDDGEVFRHANAAFSRHHQRAQREVVGAEQGGRRGGPSRDRAITAGYAMSARVRDQRRLDPYGAGASARARSPSPSGPAASGRLIRGDRVHEAVTALEPDGVVDGNGVDPRSRSARSSTTG